MIKGENQGVRDGKRKRVRVKDGKTERYRRFVVVRLYGGGNDLGRSTSTTIHGPRVLCERRVETSIDSVLHTALGVQRNAQA